MGLKRLLGQILFEKGDINKAQLDQAVFTQRINQKKLGQTLIELGHITQEQLDEALVLQEH